MKNFFDWIKNGNKVALIESVSPAEKTLEDIILDSIKNPSVTQEKFNSLLSDYVKLLAPHTHKEEFVYPAKLGDPTVYLSGQHSEALAKASDNRREETGKSYLGLLVTPLTYRYLYSKVLKNYDAIGIDNGMFSEAGRENFDWDIYKKMIKFAMAQVKVGVLDSLQFFAIPDQPFDWKATLTKYHAHKKDVDKLRQIGAPAALCVQDGADVGNIPWDGIDAIFIGGSTDWKTGDEVREIVKAARKRNMPVHMGRVNTLQRMNKASIMRVGTVDGTTLKYKLTEVIFKIIKEHPRMPSESDKQYDERIKRLFNGSYTEKDKQGSLRKNHITEKEVVDHLIDKIVDIQTQNIYEKRYIYIKKLLRDGVKLNRDSLYELDRFMPKHHVGEPFEDVVLFDKDGNIVLDENGYPARNDELFRRLYLNNFSYEPRSTYHPEYPVRDNTITVDPEYEKEVNKLAIDYRKRGIMPH